MCQLRQTCYKRNIFVNISSSTIPWSDWSCGGTVLSSWSLIFGGLVGDGALPGDGDFPLCNIVNTIQYSTMKTTTVCRSASSAELFLQLFVQLLGLNFPPNLIWFIQITSRYNEFPKNFAAKKILHAPRVFFFFNNILWDEVGYYPHWKVKPLKTVHRLANRKSKLQATWILELSRT